jgi:hypothetical protein
VDDDANLSDTDYSPMQKRPKRVSQDVNGLGSDDPLTSFYFRLFSHLFAQLEAAKPVLVQGD